MTPVNLSVDPVGRVADKIVEIETRLAPSSPFIPTRYPYTYAYDYVRTHLRDFGLKDMASRADVAGLLRDHPSKELIVRILADAYLRENNIRRDHG